MSQRFTCDTCYHYSNNSCPYGLRAGSGLCPSYTPDGAVWDSLREPLCPNCEHYDADGFCGVTGYFCEKTPSMKCTAFTRMKDVLLQEEPVPQEPGAIPVPVQQPGVPAPVDSLPGASTPFRQAENVPPAPTDASPSHSAAPHTAGRADHPQTEEAGTKRPFSLHLYFLNPFTLLGVLIIFVAFGFCFHVSPWSMEMWQTGVCTLAAMLLMSFVFGLIWGVMNPQCRPARFLLSGCLGAAASIALWRTDTFLHLLIAIGAGFVVMCVCFLLAWLGTMATNSLFGVKKRFEKRFAQPGA